MLSVFRWYNRYRVDIRTHTQYATKVFSLRENVGTFQLERNGQNAGNCPIVRDRFEFVSAQSDAVDTQVPDDIEAERFHSIDTSYDSE